MSNREEDGTGITRPSEFSVGRAPVSPNFPDLRAFPFCSGSRRENGTRINFPPNSICEQIPQVIEGQALGELFLTQHIFREGAFALLQCPNLFLDRILH